jgi:hypothetical protein
MFIQKPLDAVFHGNNGCFGCLLTVRVQSVKSKQNALFFLLTEEKGETLRIIRCCGDIIGKGDEET